MDLNVGTWKALMRDVWMLSTGECWYGCVESTTNYRENQGNHIMVWSWKRQGQENDVYLDVGIYNSGTVMKYHSIDKLSMAIKKLHIILLYITYYFMFS